jgi:hypothetical protein
LGLLWFYRLDREGRMKNLLSVCGTVAALLAVLTVPALAASPTLPSAFQGNWCHTETDANHGFRCAPDAVEDLWRALQISPTGYRAFGSHWSCTFTSLTFNTDKTGVAAEATCTHRSGSWKERGIFVLDNGTLTSLTVGQR